MPSKDEFIARRPALTLNITGYFGSGKTLQSLSFPKCYVISCDPQGLETVRQPRNQRFLDNLVWFEELHNESEADLKVLFSERETSRKSIYGCLNHVRELAAKGEVESLVVDGFTYFCDMKWQQINEFETVKSGTTGNIDTQAMYRNLGLYLHRFVASDLMTMATRNRLNIVLTTHLKRESEETVHGNEKLKNRARKVMTNSDIAPMIEGGFRNKLSGLVGADLYLEKTMKDGKYVYEAICDVTRALGTTVLAKNRFGLPTRLDLTDKSLYDAIMNSLQLKTGGTVVPAAASARPTTAGA